ncbi:MAG TPA: hypothetical protein VGB23_00255 [Nitrospirota bacterium]|jgi:hypothetical protein
MDRQKMKRTIGRLGILGGLAAFLAFGLLNGALVGGTVGLDTWSYMSGGAAGSDIGPRVMTAVGMITGVMITGAMFGTFGLAAGRVAGSFILAADGTAVKTDTAKTAHTR